MKIFERLFIGILVLSSAAALRGQTFPFQCIATAGIPPLVRAEGLTEQVGDLILSCSGGVPTPAGLPIPSANFTLRFNTNVTSRLTAAGTEFAEPLLIVDEPNSAVNPARPLLNCGNTGAPDSSASGPAVCAAVSTGDPALSYDGTPNGYGNNALCDGSGGRPFPNSFSCGRPNAFQGRISTNQGNAITFYGVPVDPPGTTTSRTFRFTNVRVDASFLGVSSVWTGYVQVQVAVNGTVALDINGPQQILAFVQSGLSAPAFCAPSGASRVRVCEGFASNWKSKNISFAVGDHNGTPGNASFSLEPYWTYNGGTNYPADVAQNVPGAIYNTETGFEWLNNEANAPPSPNPPLGTGTVQVTNSAYPFNSVGYGGVNTGIAADGLADSGTRIAFTFANIPTGASVQIPSTVYLTNGSANPTGVMVLTSTDAAGAGPFTPSTRALTASDNLAVYEVLWADPFSAESAEVAYTLLNAPPGTTLQVTTSFAPFYSDAASRLASATDPQPRFLSPASACTYSIAPPGKLFTTAGDVAGVAVTAPAGCAWAANSALSWVTIASGATGSGNGTTIIQVAANTGPARSGTITVAGQTYLVSQNGAACGATDVSNEVVVTRDPIKFSYAGGVNFFAQDIHVTNYGANVAGPVSVIFDGLCKSNPFFCPITSGYKPTTCEIPPPGAYSPIVLVSSTGIAAKQTINYTVRFYANPYTNGVTQSSVTTRVFSGVPSQ